MRDRELPIGSGHEIIEEREKLKLPAVEVNNSVIWSNNAFKGTLPFDVTLGRPMKLGVFFTPNPEKHEGERTMQLQLLPEQEATRSGLAGSVIFKDKDGNMWRDVDVKGIGKIQFYGAGLWPEVQSPSHEKSYQDELEAIGLEDFNHAERNRIMAERFLKASIRTYRTIGMSLLEEIIDDDGDKISIEEAKERGMIPRDMQPVAEMRAFVTKERIGGIHGGSQTAERWNAALQDAKMLVTQELGIKPEEFSNRKYLEWFAKTLGEQIAKLHKLGLAHNYLSAHNITLDCRIIDLDSVDTAGDENTTPERNRERDTPTAENSLAQLIGNVLGRSMINTPTGDTYLSLFKRSYTEEMAKKQSTRKKKEI